MFKFKKDKYASNRGGTSVLLEISCEHCGEHVCYYQKDGPGQLKRMYCDRIVSPPMLVEEVKGKEFNDLKPLYCSKCNKLIAVPMIYEKEKRNALRLFVGAVKKQKITIKEYEKIAKTQNEL